MSEVPDDQIDVAYALASKTHDGPGFENEDELPPSDFESFATDDVEVDQ
jgi:hypothetical protein